MKGFLNTFTSLCAVCLLLLSTNAFAQEGQPLALPGDFQQDPNQINLNEDKTLLYEPAKSIKDSTSVQSSKPAAHSAKSKNTTPQKTAREEDALSFNFLYFIIQKFKISDIIDQ